MIIARRAAAVSVVLVGAGLLGACGGGGGGGGGGSAAVAPAATPQLSTVVVPQGKGATLFIPSSATGLSSIQPSTSSATLVGGTGATASLTGPASTGTLQRETTVPVVGLSQVYVDSQTNPTAALTVSRDAGTATPLADASYGLFAITTSSGASLGGYHYGNATSAASMPTTSAVYNGKFTGVSINQFGASNELSGTSTMNANFGSGTVNGTVSNLTSSSVSVGYGLSMAGTISGNTYSGTAGFTNPAGTPSGAATASALNGGFYGAGAAETAGALTVQGTSGAGGPVAITGAFGGRR